MYQKRYSVLLIAGFSLGVTLQLHGATIRVDHESTASSPDGSTWSNSYADLQDALDYAATHTGPHSLWVADGGYYPTVRTDTGDARSVTFLMLEGVRIYGGFQGISRSGGGETQLNQRSPDLYETIVSGNIGNTGSAADNAYHIVTAEDVDSSSRLNGVTVRDGYADGEGDNGVGAGMWIKGDSAPLIIRCRFTSNHAAAAGGAVEIKAPEEIPTTGPQFLACTFDNNNSDKDGGAVSINRSTSGVALVTFVNCLAYDNQTGESGAGAFVISDGAALMVWDCTITRNFTDSSDDVGAIHLIDGHTNILNSIVWGNTNLNGSPEVAQISLKGTTDENIYNCDIQNLDYFAGHDSIDVDPLFVDADNDDFRLQYLSQLLNNGDAQEVPEDIYDINDDGVTNVPIPDRAMQERQVNPATCVDIGAMEESTEGTCAGDITDGYGGGPDGDVGDPDLDLVLTRGTGQAASLTCIPPIAATAW